jgi:hypothetical protein
MNECKNGQKDCNIREANDKLKHIEENRRKTKNNFILQRNIAISAYAIACVKGINAL